MDDTHTKSALSYRRSKDEDKDNNNNRSYLILWVLEYGKLSAI